MGEPVWHERHLVGFGNRLKDRDGVKGKVAESLAVKGRTVAEAMQLLPDAIRYTFQYCEADYGRHLLEDVELTERQGFELVRLRNFWRGDQYKGISSLWRDPATGQLFEVQFHTEISYHAMVLTAEHSYARLRSAQTCAQEEIELEAFQRKVYAHVPVPPGADGFPGYPADAGWQVPGKRANPGPSSSGPASARVAGGEPPRHGNSHATIEPYRAFEASDGGFLLAVGTDRQFDALCGKVLGRDDIARDARFSTNASRVVNREELVPILASLFVKEPRTTWLERCKSAGVPAGPVAGVLEAIRSSQATALGSVLETTRGGRSGPPPRPPFFLAGF